MTNSRQPAFPISEEETDRIDAKVKIYSGLTKREYFTAMAMQGLLSDPQVTIGKAVELAIQAADELLAALESNNSQA